MGDITRVICRARAGLRGYQHPPAGFPAGLEALFFLVQTGRGASLDQITA